MASRFIQAQQDLTQATCRTNDRDLQTSEFFALLKKYSPEELRAAEDVLKHDGVSSYLKPWREFLDIVRPFDRR